MVNYYRRIINNVPGIEPENDVLKVNKESSPNAPTKKVFDVKLPDTGSDNQDSPTKLDFTDAYDDDHIQPDKHEDESNLSNVERPPTPPLRRSF